MTEPLWIEERDALVLHDRLLALHGGAAGVRDDALLKSALARPQQMDAYANSPDLIDLAAAYTVGIVRNHPFIRTWDKTIEAHAPANARFLSGGFVLLHADFSLSLPHGVDVMPCLHPQ